MEQYDLRSGRSHGRFAGHDGALTGLCTSSNGKLLYTLCRDRFFRIFSVETRVLLFQAYMKDVPQCMAVIDETWLIKQAKKYSSLDDEEIWESMPSVTDLDRKKVKNPKISQS